MNCQFAQRTDSTPTVSTASTESTDSTLSTVATNGGIKENTFHNDFKSIIEGIEAEKGLSFDFNKAFLNTKEIRNCSNDS